MLFNSLAATTALNTLREVNSQIDATSRAVSTGKSIPDAAANPTIWSIATGIESTRNTLSTVAETMNLGRSLFDVTETALDGVRNDLEEVQQLLVSARQAGADRATIQTQIAGYLADADAKAGAADFNGQNLLTVDSSAAGYNATFSVAANFESSAAGISITTIDVDVDSIKLIDPAGGTADGILDQDRTVGGTTVAVTAIDISALTDATADMTTLEETIAIVDAAIADVTAAQSIIGVASNRADSQGEFLSALISANDRAVSTLVDANLEEEAAKLTALQTQQQLAVQALAINNNSLASVLQLFR